MRLSIRLMDRFGGGFSAAVGLGILAFTCAQVPAADLQEVTVAVPAVRTIGRDATGTPIQQVTTMARVQYNPVMLTTNSGRALLDDKVAEVARRLCTASGRVNNTDDDAGCVRQAIYRAKVQIAAAAALQKGG